MAPSKTKKTQAAGTTQQDKAEEINLTNTDNLNNEVVDTVTATQEGGKKIKAKKEKKEPKEETKEESSEETETVTAHPLEDTPKPKKERKPKAAKEAKEPKEVKEPKEKKRAPSAYNLFVKEIMPVLKKENEGVAQRDLMKLAAERWNAKKATDAKQ
jgi:hypothetical protein